MTSLMVLRKPVYLGATIALTAFLSWLYSALSLRSGGTKTTIFTTKLATPEFEITTFGPAYYYGSVALDLLTALLAAVLIVLTVANYRARRGSGVLIGSVGPTASVAVAATAFG